MSFLKSLFSFQTSSQKETSPTETASVDRSSPHPLFRNRYRFVAVDVETANRTNHSICQIGFAGVTETNDIATHSFYLDPEEPFDSGNISIHGITPQTVRGAVTFPTAMETIRTFMDTHALVQHSSFDKRAFDQACENSAIPPLATTWFDSVTMARRAWPEFTGNGGHGLAHLKQALSLEFTHHDAGEDARAAATVALLAEQVTGKSFGELGGKKNRRAHYAPSITMQGNPDGALFGQTVVFTGKLNLSREEAANRAACAGLSVKAGMSKAVTLLVVGQQDLELTKGNSKSSKHRKAEKLIEDGQKLSIIGEDQFIKMTE